MASEQPTATATKIKLEPPEALQAITVHEAAGLVPLKGEETSELDAKVAKFVDELAAMDSNSPEFGKKVDQLTAMGRKEISEAAGASNRFLDRPVKAIDADTGIGADLTELRRTVEKLDPKENGAGMTKRKFLGIIPMGNRINHYFDKYRSSQTHISAILNRLAGTAHNAAVRCWRFALVLRGRFAVPEAIRVTAFRSGPYLTGADVNNTDKATLS